MRPASDPLLPIVRSQSADGRLNALRLRILTHLWREDLAQTLDNTLDGRFPRQGLEDRIRAVLDPKAVRLVAAMSGFRPIAAERAAALVLAAEVRAKAGIFIPSVRNPSAPFQRLRVNDRRLYSGHTSRLPVEMVERDMSEICSKGARYWPAVEKSALYTADDLDVLIQWKMRPGPGSMIASNSRSPTQEMAFECARFAERHLAFQQHTEILKEIAVSLPGTSSVQGLGTSWTERRKSGRSAQWRS